MEKSMSFDDWSTYCKTKYIGSKIVGRDSKKEGTEGMEYWCVPQSWKEDADTDRLFSAYSINKQSMVYDDPETSGKALVLLPSRYYGVDAVNKFIIGPYKTEQQVQDRLNRSGLQSTSVMIGTGKALDPILNGVRA